MFRRLFWAFCLFKGTHYPISSGSWMTCITYIKTHRRIFFYFDRKTEIIPKNQFSEIAISAKNVGIMVGGLVNQNEEKSPKYFKDKFRFWAPSALTSLYT